MLKNVGIIEADSLLEIPLSNNGRNVKKNDINNFLLTLIGMGAIDVLPKGILSETYRKTFYIKKPINMNWPNYRHLSSPETVHWAVTYQCAQACPDCYVDRHKSLFQYELNTEEAYTLIDKVADSGVFQLAQFKSILEDQY